MNIIDAACEAEEIFGCDYLEAYAKERRKAMSHTPGPWTISEGLPCDVLYTDEEGSLATVVRDLTNEADARLISAAPDLLAALNNARNVLSLALHNGAWGEESSDEQDSRDEVAGVLATMEEAIKKAEGG